MASMLQPGVLTLAATPIGNPLDVSVRLMRALASAELIAAAVPRRRRRVVADVVDVLPPWVLARLARKAARRTGRPAVARRARLRRRFAADGGLRARSEHPAPAPAPATSPELAVPVLPGP